MIGIVLFSNLIFFDSGPANDQGLLGLFLEINEGKKTLACTEMIGSSISENTLEVPKKEKVVSQKKHANFKKQKTAEMMEKLKARMGFRLRKWIEHPN